MKQRFVVSLLLWIIVLSWSNVRADFYVIAAGKRAVRTILVSPKASAAESGTALLNAIAGITDNDRNKPYLIKIEPGIYDLGQGHCIKGG